MSRSGWGCNAMVIVAEVKAKFYPRALCQLLGKLIDMGHLSPLDSLRAKKEQYAAALSNLIYV